MPLAHRQDTFFDQDLGRQRSCSLGEYSNLVLINAWYSSRKWSLLSQVPGRRRQVGRTKRSVTWLKISPVFVLTNTSRHLFGGTLIFLHKDEKQVLFQGNKKRFDKKIRFGGRKKVWTTKKFLKRAPFLTNTSLRGYFLRVLLNLLLTITFCCALIVRALHKAEDSIITRGRGVMFETMRHMRSETCSNSTTHIPQL